MPSNTKLLQIKQAHDRHMDAEWFILAASYGNISHYNSSDVSAGLTSQNVSYSRFEKVIKHSKFK